MERFTRLTIGPRPGPGTSAPASAPGPGVRPRAERAVLADYPELAGAPERVRRVQVANLGARRRFDAESRRQRRRYRDYLAGLAGGPRQIEVSDLGDCFFEAVQVMAGNHLAEIGEEFGWEGREPSVAQMRAAIADALADDFEDYRAHLGAGDAQEHGFYARRFPDLMELEDDEAAQRELLENHLAWIAQAGNWNADAGDNVVDIAAHLWRLQLTALGPDNPVDYGPPDSTAQRGYLLYTGAHYLGVARVEDDPARPAAELLGLPAEPGFEVPAGIGGRELAQDFVTGFDELRGVAAAVPGVPQDRLAGLVALFEGATAAAVTAGGEAALANELRRMSGFYRDVGDLLRHARAAAGPVPVPGPGRPAKRGRDGEEEEPEGQQAKRGRAAGPKTGHGHAACPAMPGDGPPGPRRPGLGGRGRRGSARLRGPGGDRRARPRVRPGR